MKLLEIWCEEFTPETFGQQTYRTFTAALRGRVEFRKREAERDLFVAYHAGLFSQVSKPKPFAYYLKQMRSDPAGDKSRGGAAVLGLMRELQAKGIPIQIERLN